MKRYRIVQYTSGKYGIEAQYRTMFIWGSWYDLSTYDTLQEAEHALETLRPGKVAKIIFAIEVKE